MIYIVEEKEIYYNTAILLIAYFFSVIVLIPDVFGMSELAELLKNIGYGIFGFIYLILSFRKELQ